MKTNVKSIVFHVVSILLILASILLAVFIFPKAWGRLIESGRDLGLSIAYYGAETMGFDHDIFPSITLRPGEVIPSDPVDPSVPIDPSDPVDPTDPGSSELLIKESLKAYFSLLIDRSNFLGYVIIILKILMIISRLLPFLLPVVLIIIFWREKEKKVVNNDWGQASKPLNVFRKFLKFFKSCVVLPVKDFVKFSIDKKYYFAVFLAVWAYNFNIFAIVLSAIAYYLYMSVSFDFGSVYDQIVKLIGDLKPLLHPGLIPIWTGLLLYFFAGYCKKIGYLLLRNKEAANRAFIENLPIVTMIVGTMGKKKTTVLTDMALSVESMFRDKAFEKLLDQDLKFPNFPWILFEKDLQSAMQRHEVYSLTTCKAFVERLKHRRGDDNLYGYDAERYGRVYNDGLKLQDLYEVMTVYAQLYFIYVIQSSLIVANYGVRSDAELIDRGNLPLWDGDFFERDPRYAEALSRHAHILDFDMLRLGKKIIQSNPNVGAFEFGVLAITEGGKERGNKIDLEGEKRQDSKANRKNDKFNLWLKMARHSATVDYFPFVRVLIDEQRPESLGADARELAQIVHVRSSGSEKVTLPFCGFLKTLCEVIISKFESRYYDFRHRRGDMTLRMARSKFFAKTAAKYMTKLRNTFGYCKVALEIEDGVLDGRTTAANYFLCNKKIYSDRFATDAFGDYFAEISKSCRYGLNDLTEYNRSKATFAELRWQNSYFITEILEANKGESKG